MTDEVETMAYAKEGGVPWHGKGTEIEGLMSPAEAQVAAGLDWKVATGPLHDHKNRPIPGRVVIYRLTDDYVLGDATDMYQPIQNDRQFHMAKAIIDQFGADTGEGERHIQTAGSLRHGRETWLLIQLPCGLVVNGNDKYETYILIRNGHDGSTGYGGWLTRVRVVCQNTMNEAIRGLALFKVEHYGTEESVESRLMKAQGTVQIVREADKRFTAWAEELANKEVKPKDVDRFQTELFGDTDGETTISNVRRNQANSWREILLEECQRMGTVNQYAVVQSITGFADHRVAVRQREDGDQRMIATFDGVIADWKNKGMKAMGKVWKTPLAPTVDQMIREMKIAVTV